MTLDIEAYRRAVSDRPGTRKVVDAPLTDPIYVWHDKPHRIVWDLCDEIERLRAELAKAEEHLNRAAEGWL